VVSSQSDNSLGTSFLYVVLELKEDDTSLGKAIALWVPTAPGLCFM